MRHPSTRPRNCVVCGECLSGTRKLRYCSDECFTVGRKRREAGYKYITYQIRCGACEEVFETRRPNQKYCSVACRGADQCVYRGTTRECVICGVEYEPRARDQKCCSKKCQMAATHRATGNIKITRQCVTCGIEYTTDPRAWNAKYCGPCKMKLYGSNGPQNRAKKWGVEYEPIDKMKVFARDHWKCGICGERVDQRKRYPHPDSASLDHIIPISCGGGHVWSNVQCSHLGCNSSKYNKVANSQLRLELTA